MLKLQISTYTLILCCFFACEKPVEDDIIVIIPPTPAPCFVIDEAIVSQDTSFYVWESWPQDKGSGKAIKLNKEWVTSAAASLSSVGDNLHVYLQTATVSGVSQPWLRERIILSFDNFEVGCQNVKDYFGNIDNNNVSVLYTAENFDVTEDWYLLDLEDELESKVEIDSIDLENNFISGKYMLSFKADYEKDANREPHNPDYIRFLNGSFSCQIDE